MTKILTLAGLLLACAPADAPAQAHGTHSPHAGSETRQIKALADDDVAGFLAGRGMGLALPAELNRYPGPRHTLDLADELGLSEQQVSRVSAIFEEMHQSAVPLGGRYVELERELDRLFAERLIDEDRLLALTAEIGRLLGELRHVHLRAHLRTTALLTQHQIRLYHEHRGYGSGLHGGH